jgi:hypothetical protein
MCGALDLHVMLPDRVEAEEGFPIVEDIQLEKRCGAMDTDLGPCVLGYAQLGTCD